MNDRWYLNREAYAFDPLGIKVGEVGGAMHLVLTRNLPALPDLWEDNLRFVRHRLADVLTWLHEDPGPKPGEPITMKIIGDVIFVCQEELDSVRRLNRASQEWQAAGPA